MPVRSLSRLSISVFLVFVTFLTSVSAQTLPVPETVPAAATEAEPQSSALSDSPVESQPLTKGFVDRFLQDQKAIWTSPIHIRAKDAKWLVPLTAATFLAFKKDQQISNGLAKYPSLQKDSLRFSEIGGPLPTIGAAGALLVLGKFRADDRMTETGFRGLQAVGYANIVMHVIKPLTDRKRPGEGGNGGFWTGGESFPSGHAMQTWALATVIADEYHDKPLIKFGMYGLASAVSFTRMSGQRHYASDVLIGSALGYLIGKFVMRHQHSN